MNRDRRGEIKIKLLADMVISPKTVSFLRDNGYNAIRVSELGMLSNTSDMQIIDYARDNGYILITMDLDFGYILAYTKQRRPSVIIFRLSNPEPTNVNRLLVELLNDNSIIRKLEEGSIIIVEDSRIRIRRLPL